MSSRRSGSRVELSLLRERLMRERLLRGGLKRRLRRKGATSPHLGECLTKAYELAGSRGGVGRINCELELLDDCATELGADEEREASGKAPLEHRPHLVIPPAVGDALGEGLARAKGALAEAELPWIRAPPWPTRRLEQPERMSDCLALTVEGTQRGGRG